MSIISESSIILIGGFNPLIFHPIWFDRYKILPIQETEWALGHEPQTREIVAKDGIKFMLSETPPVIVQNNLAEVSFRSVKIRVTTDKFAIFSSKPSDNKTLKEATMKIFATLPHSPVRAIGFNFHGHARYSKYSREILNELFVADKNLFRKYFGESFTASGKIQYTKSNAQVSIDISASNRLENGIHCGANFHREISETTGSAADIINVYFDDDFEETERAIKKVFGKEEEVWTP